MAEGASTDAMLSVDGFAMAGVWRRHRCSLGGAYERKGSRFEFESSEYVLIDDKPTNQFHFIGNSAGERVVRYSTQITIANIQRT